MIKELPFPTHMGIDPEGHEAYYIRKEVLEDFLKETRTLLNRLPSESSKTISLDEVIKKYETQIELSRKLHE